MVELLLNAGAYKTIEAQDNTALSPAKQRGHQQIVALQS